MIARILVAASVAALAISGAATAQTRGASHSVGKPGGIVRPQVNGIAVGSWASRNAGTANTSGPTRTDNLSYNGGSVMHTNKVYTIFWVPSGYSIPSNYKSVVNRYFTDIAADSGKASNVYASDVQYSDSTNGNIRYSTTFAGSKIDTHGYYASNCTTPSDVSGTTVCMSDKLLQKEVKRFADAQGWAHGPNVEIFLYTAHNVETCFLSDSEAAGDPVDQACAYDYYCAYHNSFTATNGQYIYANMPFPNQTFIYNGATYSSDCVDSTAQGFPNSGGAAAGTNAAAADAVINVSSHEGNESITDPNGDAWWVSNPASLYSGYENGDLCAWYFPSSANLGGSGTTRYNQVVHGHHYFVQGEWSNASATGTANSGCVWSYDMHPANTAVPTISGTALVGSQLTGHAGTWSNSPTSYTYKWLRCNTSGASCAVVASQATSSTTANYTVASADSNHTIRLRVIATNSSGPGTAATSSATATVAALPVNTAAPAVSGTTTVGHVLTGSAGTWTNSPTSYTYKWLRCNSSGASCLVVHTATTSAMSAMYTLVTGDANHTIKIRVTATNGAGTTAAVDSPHTAVVAT